MSDHEALLEFAEAVEEDTDGIWIEECDGEVVLCLKGWAGIKATAEAYVVACNALGRPIMATVTFVSEQPDQAGIAKLLDLPRIRF